MADAGLADIIELIDQYPGLLWHHCKDSRHCQGTRGLPDLIILGPRGVLFAEVKPDGPVHLGIGQTSWKYGFRALGLRHVVWQPRNVASGVVEADLEAIL